LGLDLNQKELEIICKFHLRSLVLSFQEGTADPEFYYQAIHKLFLLALSSDFSLKESLKSFDKAVL